MSVSTVTVPVYLNSLMLISLIGIASGHELKIFRRIYFPEVHVLVVIYMYMKHCNDSCINKRNLWTLITYIASHSMNLQRRHDSRLTNPRGKPTAKVQQGN
jgi:uncharacterized membrane protein (Fun14 family)